MAGRNRIIAQNRRGKRQASSAANDAKFGCTPEIRIVRKQIVPDVHHLSANESMMLDFLANHSNRNYGQGTTLAMGGLAVSFITAQEFGKMLSEKYPNDYGKSSHAKTKQLVNRFSAAFNEFVLQNDTIVTKMLGDLDQRELCARADLEQLDYGGTSFYPELEMEQSRLSTNQLWVASKFKIKGIEPYRAGLYLGFDLNHHENQALKDERNYIIDQFLVNDQNLSRRHIDKAFDPHATFFRGYSSLGTLALQYMNPPHSIMLEKPTAVVNLTK